MSTTPVPAPTQSKVSLILNIIQLALAGLQTVVPGAAIAETLLTIFQNASAAYHAETGMPFNVTKIPLETPVP